MMIFSEAQNIMIIFWLEYKPFHPKSRLMLLDFKSIGEVSFL
jgi:hypothetical protein